MTRRVVVTGLGTVNPIGIDVESFWKAALAGTSGVGPIESFDPSALKTRFAGEVGDFDVTNYM
ncbi:hypothetical protein HQ535_00115, partial [bacterium]|nr:hypothetical protein [bacterium]